MPNFVIDASVVVAAVSPAEAGHDEALSLLRRAHATHSVFHEPPQFLLELYAVLSRRPRELRAVGFMTEDDPMEMRFVPLGESEINRLLGWLSDKCPGKCPTRGADLAYVSAAIQTGHPLVTFDSGLQKFSECGLNVIAPGDVSIPW